MSVGNRGSSARMAGHALTEALVCLPVLMLILSVIPVLGRYVDMRQTTLNDSRQRLWHATLDANPADRPQGSSPAWLATAQLSTSTLENKVPVSDWLGYWLEPCAGESPDSACIVETAAILADDWSSASDEEGAAQARQWVPARRFAPAGVAMSSLAIVPWLDELAPLDTGFGYVDMQAMPVEQPSTSSERDLP